MTAIEHRVLIVEDEPGWRAVYADLLDEAAGYICEYAASYGEARGLLQRHPFALAIVDLHLASAAGREANRDGFGLLRIARQGGVPAIVVSALGAPEDIDRAYDEFGVFAFIEKEAFDRRAFARTVAEALHSTVSAEVGGASSLAALTARERDVLALLTRGDTNRQIAETLGVTPNTVKKHVDHILQKLGASSRAGAVAAAVRAGLVSSGPNG
jgi:DNA-binding NarL/FixJ family response regulator